MAIETATDSKGLRVLAEPEVDLPNWIKTFFWGLTAVNGRRIKAFQLPGDKFFLRDGKYYFSLIPNGQIHQTLYLPYNAVLVILSPDGERELSVNFNLCRKCFANTGSMSSYTSCDRTREKFGFNCVQCGNTWEHAAQITG